jgi:hypothetical protein
MAETPKWSVPSPFGQAAAIEGMASVASPLLAGFAVTFAGLVLASSQDVRWVSAALGLLMAAALSLIAALQCGFHARQWVITPSEILEWYPNASDERIAELEIEQKTHHANHQTWADRARWTYNLGILLFLAGLVVALVPPGTVSNGRLAVVAIILLGFSLEAAWMLGTELPRLLAMLRT